MTRHEGEMVEEKNKRNRLLKEVVTNWERGGFGRTWEWYNRAGVDGSGVCVLFYIVMINRQTRIKQQSLPHGRVYWIN